MRKLKVGLLGCGTVGRGLVGLVTKNDALIRQRSGVELSITKILVRDPHKPRPGVDPALITTDPEHVLKNGCDLVVELVGGIEPARSFILQSFAAGKHVVTANKALLAHDGLCLVKDAESRRLRLGFEASVCGGIPIIRALRNGLVGNNIQSLTGILNGTCNYILTRMTDDGLGFDAALREAQEKGFAEADPTLDVDGHDAAQKLKILAELAFASPVPTNVVQVDGIRQVRAEDVESVHEAGFVIRHVAMAEIAEQSVSLRAAPVLVSHAHQLASVREENNAVLLRGDAVGDMLFCGKGAGSLPSASAVLSDVVDIACHKGDLRSTQDGSVEFSMRDYESKHYLRFSVSDPSAIGVITTILERNGVPVERASAVWAKTIQSQHQVRIWTQDTSRRKLDLSVLEAKDQSSLVEDALALRVLG